MNPHSKHLPADQRHAVTVEAVVELAAEQNPSDITTAAIAAQMDLTQGALFRHFPSKDAILEAVMAWVAGSLLARVDKAAQGAAASVAALEAVFMAHIDFVSEHPGMPRMLFGQLQRPGKIVPKKKVQTLLHHYDERRGELDVDAAVVLFIGTIQGLVMQALLAGDTRRMCQEAAGAFAIHRRGIASTP